MAENELREERKPQGENTFLIRKVDKNGNLREQGLLVNGKKEDVWEEWDTEGKPISFGSYKEGLKDGPWKEWDEKGGLSMGAYENGKRTGVWKELYPNALFKSAGLYKDGKKDGHWEYWHPNGRFESRGSYQDGKQAGIWKGWHDNGFPLYEGVYEAGLQQGVWIDVNDKGEFWVKIFWKGEVRLARMETELGNFCKVFQSCNKIYEQASAGCLIRRPDSQKQRE